MARRHSGRGRPGVVGRLRRRMDRRLYRALFALYRSAFPTAVAGVPIDRTALRRILVVRHDRVGDLIVTTPLLSLLREAASRAELDVLASPANAPLLRADPRVAHLFVNDHSWRGWLTLLPALRRRRYDLVISPIYGRGLREGVVASLVAHRLTHKVSIWRPVRYAGFFSRVIRVPRTVTHMADHLLYVGQRTLGIEPSPAAAAAYPLQLAADPVAEAAAEAFVAAQGLRRFLVVNVSSAEWWREWPPARCATVLSALLARHSDLTAVVAPAPGKEAAGAEVVRRCATSRMLLAPVFSLPVLTAVVRRAYAVLTCDTALVHVASAVGCPVVVLTDPRIQPGHWRPRGVPHRVLSATSAGAGLASIPPEAVGRAFDDLRAQLRDARPPAGPS